MTHEREITGRLDRAGSRSGARRPGRWGRGSPWVPRIGTGVLLAVAAFQVALASGAPWGRLAWGGGQRGTLPAGLRVSSVVSALVLVALASLMVTGPRTTVRRCALRAAAGLFAVGTLMNAISPSVAERLTWTPMAAALAVLFWLRASG